MCPECEGLGKAKTILIDRLIDKEKSLNEGAILFPTFQPGDFRWKRYTATGLFDNDKKLKDYTEEEMDTLLYKTGFKPANPTKEWPPTSLYEGVVPRIKRSFLHKDGQDNALYKEAIKRIASEGICPACRGGRLKPDVLTCRINGKNIADCASMPVNELIDFVRTVREPLVRTVTEAIVKRLADMIEIGLGYLSLNRETSSLSGGESQRIKLVRQLGNSLSDLLYILDEPSSGLHPHDVGRINRLLRQLRDKGNTVLIVEHDPDVIRIADHIVEMGPSAGTGGGRIVYEGELGGLMSADTLTSRLLKRRLSFKSEVAACRMAGNSAHEPQQFERGKRPGPRRGDDRRYRSGRIGQKHIDPPCVCAGLSRSDRRRSRGDRRFEQVQYRHLYGHIRCDPGAVRQGESGQPRAFQL